MSSSYLITEKRRIFESKENEYQMILDSAFADYAAPDAEAASAAQKRIINVYMSYDRHMKKAQQEYNTLEQNFLAGEEAFFRRGDSWADASLLSAMEEEFRAFRKTYGFQKDTIFERRTWSFTVNNTYIKTSHDGLYDFTMYGMKTLSMFDEQCGAAWYLAEKIKAYMLEKEPGLAVEYHRNDRFVSFML